MAIGLPPIGVAMVTAATKLKNYILSKDSEKFCTCFVKVEHKHIVQLSGCLFVFQPHSLAK